MATASHAHPIAVADVEQARRATLSVPSAERLATLLSLLSDPTRLRAVVALAGVDELCVGDLALALDISMDQASYALKQLRGAGVVQARREGRAMYYRLADGFPRQLLEHCLHDLMKIAEKKEQS